MNVFRPVGKRPVLSCRLGFFQKLKVNTVSHTGMYNGTLHSNYFEFDRPCNRASINFSRWSLNTQMARIPMTLATFTAVSQSKGLTLSSLHRALSKSYRGQS